MDRQPLTMLVQSNLATTSGFPCGIGSIPSGGGWQGQPNTSGTNFKPFTIIIPQSTGTSTGPLTDTQADWHMPYSVQSFGITAAQSEHMADQARLALQIVKHTVLSLGDGNYQVQQVRVDQIGSLQRVDTTDPPFWGQNDLLNLWLAKEST